MSKQTELQQYHAHNDQLVGELTTEKQLVLLYNMPYNSVLISTSF